MMKRVGFIAAAMAVFMSVRERRKIVSCVCFEILVVYI